jgi:hypothetical protein
VKKVKKQKLILVMRKTEVKYVEDNDDANKVVAMSGSEIKMFEVIESLDGCIYDEAATLIACLGMSMADADDCGYTTYEFLCAYDAETKADVSKWVERGKVDESKL